MTATRIGRLATLAVLVFLWLLAASTLWQTQVPGNLARPDLSATEVWTEEQLEASADYARVARGIWLGGVVSQLAVLALLAALGPRLARRLGGRPLVRGLALLLGVLALVWVARLPFGLAGHWWRRRHDLSRQEYLAWVLDPWLELIVGVLIACLALGLAMVLAARIGTRWWLAGGPILAVVGAAVVLTQPLVMAPRLDALRDEALAADIRDLGAEMGVDVVAVEERRASPRTTRVNAQVSGIGPTRRVILWDTLLDGRVPAGEIRFIAAHELAHVTRHHLWKGLAWFALLAVPLVLVVAEVTRRLGGLAEPGAVPLAVLTVVALQLALLPFANTVSRRYEAEADWVALQATRDPDAARSLFRRFAETNLGQPDPPRWSRPLLGTHPTLLERVELAEAWRRVDERRPGGA
jgi:STE24 endopeptidase